VTANVARAGSTVASPMTSGPTVTSSKKPRAVTIAPAKVASKTRLRRPAACFGVVAVMNGPGAPGDTISLPHPHCSTPIAALGPPIRLAADEHRRHEPQGRRREDDHDDLPRRGRRRARPHA